VLHHTGAMWKALENIVPLVADNGRLYISIYNDQGGASTRWRVIKRLYNKSPGLMRLLLVFLVCAYFELRSTVGRLSRRQNPLPFRYWSEYKRQRGMSVWHDRVDWAGGYPFEVAKPEDIFDFFKDKGFTLAKLRTCGGGPGCNEFVFEKRTKQ